MTHDLQTFVRGLRGRIAAADRRAAVPDAELLRRFRESGDEAAFELLVWRHGSLVLGTCRRILGRSADVEDAFQATFLALVRHSKRIRNGEILAGWLHRVARRIAQHARSAPLERLRREQRAGQFESVNHASIETSDLRPLLDEEIDRLPTPFRLAFTLCCLEGKTHEEAARQLGVPVGTLRSRLARAREKLRFRLSRQGVTLGASGISIGLIRAELSAAMVNSAMETITGSETAAASAAMKLMEGALHMTLLKKTKVTVAILMALTFAAGSTSWARHGLRPRRRCSPPLCVCPEPAQAAIVLGPPPVAATEPAKAEEKPKPPEVTKEPEIKPRLKQILAEFVERNKKRRHILASGATRTEKTLAGTKVYEGEIRILAPSHACVRMTRKDWPNDYELLVWTSGQIYQYLPQSKKVIVQSNFGQLGPFAPPLFFGRQIPLLGPLSYLLGLDFPELARRIDLKLAENLSEQNPNYFCIEMRPRNDEDKLAFTRAQVVLFANTMLPRRVSCERANGDQITWDFPSMDETTELKPADFTPPEPPAGWKTVKN